jgi:hypothetical protein
MRGAQVRSATRWGMPLPATLGNCDSRDRLYSVAQSGRDLLQTSAPRAPEEKDNSPLTLEPSEGYEGAIRSRT